MICDCFDAKDIYGFLFMIGTLVLLGVVIWVGFFKR